MVFWNKFYKIEKIWNANEIEINPNMILHAYVHDKNPKMAKIS